MSDTPFVVRFNEVSQVNLPHYYDYAYVIQRIKETLFEKYGLSVNMYMDNENQQEIWNVLAEDVEAKREDLEFVAYVMDGIETHMVTPLPQTHGVEFTVSPFLDNAMYYYPRFRVALARATVFHSSGPYHHHFILTDEDANLLEFIAYIQRRQREHDRRNVAVFTDTDDGLERKKVNITHLVQREDVLLEEDLKRQIYRSIDEFFHDSGEFFRTYNIPYKRGILLYGKPGNGKTTLVKSIANTITAPVAYWQITEYTNSYSIKQVFETALKMAPMVLVIEDIDSMPESVRSVFLNTLDGVTSKEGIFLIGTTNYPEKIDPALINRAGRFDRAYEIKLPNREMRLRYLKKLGFARFLKEQEMEKLAEALEGSSIAQLNELYITAALEWHYEKSVNLEKLLEEMQTDIRKLQKQQWDSDDEAGRLGFY
ncbi:ATP-binding protein [Ammoniphilus sp. CFH 90114]|uniref:AAA family ATPase n=1 Tax=Ammoniphilus sp. CFH 90114 TaxID=2493665 RepID=UPI00100F9B2A|nr:ATP-binding protein [Ammoniphilus sp. CFH 90114]RXT02856.1 ATP-binding protein [Ammoniphilus sp. CFH 90114]